MFGSSGNEAAYKIAASRVSTSGRTRVSPTLDPQENTAILFCLGQSNIGNWASGSYTVTQSKNHNVNVEDGCVYACQEPVLNAQRAQLAFSGVDRTSCVVSRLGDKLIVGDDFDRVITFNVAFGGTRWEDWAATGTFDMKTRLTRGLRRALNMGYTPTYFLIELGESDAAAAATKVNVKTAAALVFAQIRSFGFTAPILLAKSTHWTGTVTEGSPAQIAVREAIDELIDHPNGIWAGPDTDTLNDTFREDGVHWNATGSDAAADLWITELAAIS